ncbi:MAG: DNA methyltransferase [Steroidobacteraceae bacterium]
MRRLCNRRPQTQVLRTLPSASMDLVVTDPPYFVRYKDRAGRSIANDGDPGSVLGAFDELFRVLRPDTYCVSFYGWNSIAAFFDAWTRAGFKAVGHIVWHKGYASRRGFLNARHEQAYVLVKGRPAKPIHPIDDVQPWEYSGNIVHPTAKAVSILKPLIQSFSYRGGVVLDAFAGSGSTLVAAALLDRHYLGIELEAKYVEHARRRLMGVERARARHASSSLRGCRGLSRQSRFLSTGACNSEHRQSPTNTSRLRVQPAMRRKMSRGGRDVRSSGTRCSRYCVQRLPAAITSSSDAATGAREPLLCKSRTDLRAHGAGAHVAWNGQ